MVSAFVVVFNAQYYAVAFRLKGDTHLVMQRIAVRFGPVELSPDAGEVGRVDHGSQNGGTTAGKRDRPLVCKDQLSQKTVKGLEIPVPKRRDCFRVLDEVAKKPRPGEEAFSVRSRIITNRPRPCL